MLRQLSISFPFKSLKEQGVDYIYLLGIWDTRGPLIVSKEAGQSTLHQSSRTTSPFAITNHVVPHPLLGSTADLEMLIQTIHRYDLGVLVDFVPNHTSTVHPWITSHADYYKDSSKTAFSGDVIELNYQSPALRNEMIDILSTIAGYGVDGFRCDMAHLVPTDFWQNAIATLKSNHPHLEFIAEAYTESVFNLDPLHSLMHAGFSCVYDEPLYRNLKMGSPTHISDHLNYIGTYEKKYQWIHYCSNHDDTFPQDPSLHQIYALLFLCLPGWHVTYNGFWNGFCRRLAHHYVDILDENYLPDKLTDHRFIRFVRWLKSHEPEFAGVTVLSDGFKVKLQLSGEIYWLFLQLSTGQWHLSKQI